MTTILIVQHGEKERLPGDPGLTTLGRAQATRTAAALERSDVAALWSSPLRRAQQTAAAVASARSLPVHTDDRLRERMNWDGDVSFEQFLAAWERTTVDRTHTPPFGDSSAVAGDRFLAALEAIAGAHPAQTVVVVAHGGVTTDAIRTLLGDEDLRARAPHLLADGVPSCAITVLERVADGWSVVDIASTRHLDERD